MDYEKKYKQALERARQLCAYPTTKPFISDLQDLFPELAESEDERIRKHLIGVVELYYGYTDEQEKKDCIAWLEKQGGLKYTQRDIDDAYLKGIADVKREVKKIDEQTEKMKKEIAEFIFNSKEDIKQRYEWIKCLGFDVKFSNEDKQSEQKPINPDTLIQQRLDALADIVAEQKSIDKVEPKFKVGDVIKNKKNGDTVKVVQLLNDSYCYSGWDGAATIYSDILFSDQDKYELVEQNPAWSEEDEEYFDDIVQSLRNLVVNGGNEAKRYTEEEIDWLKSLKERVQPQPKQEWSEEDEAILENIIKILDGVTKGITADITLKEIHSFIVFLRSLRPQNTWKPSDEQMDALRYVTNFDYGGYKATLVSLYEQLKKLRGE